MLMGSNIAKVLFAMSSETLCFLLAVEGTCGSAKKFGNQRPDRQISCTNITTMIKRNTLSLEPSPNAVAARETPVINPPPVTNPQPDAELLALFNEGGNRAALEPLVLRYSGLVYSVVSRVVYQAQDREDACQATFLTLVRSASRIRNQHSIASWLYSTAFRIALRIRNRSRNNTSPLSTEDISLAEPAMPDPLTRISQDMDFEKLNNELQNLPQSLREPLIEHYFLGLTAPQIAERMDLSISAVEGRLRRGKQRLRTELARKGIGMSIVLTAAASWTQNSVDASEHITRLCLQAVAHGSGLSSSIGTETAQSNSSSANVGGNRLINKTNFDNPNTLVNTHVLSLVESEIAMSTLGLYKLIAGVGVGACALVATAAIQNLVSGEPSYVQRQPLTAVSSPFENELNEDEAEIATMQIAAAGSASQTQSAAGSSGGAGAPTAGGMPGAEGAKGMSGSTGMPGGAIISGSGSGAVMPDAGAASMGGDSSDPFGSDEGTRGSDIDTTISKDWARKAEKASIRILQAKSILESASIPIDTADVASHVLQQVSSLTDLPILMSPQVASELQTFDNLSPMSAQKAVFPDKIEQMRAAQLLELTLKANELHYVVYSDRIEVISEDELDSQVLVHIYNIRHLLKGNRTDEPTNLRELIVGFVFRDQDVSQGGTANATIVGGSLIVTCNHRIQRELEVFLGQLAKVEGGFSGLLPSFQTSIQQQQGIGGLGGLGGASTSGAAPSGSATSSGDANVNSRGSVAPNQAGAHGGMF